MMFLISRYHVPMVKTNPILKADDPVATISVIIDNLFCLQRYPSFTTPSTLEKPK
jgi:hypothetical protein